MTGPTEKDGIASTKSVAAAVRFGICIIQDQIKRTEQEEAVAFLQERAAHFENLLARINAGKKEEPSHTDLGSLYNVVQSYHNARMTTTPWDAAEGEHFYNAAVGALRDDLYTMMIAVEELSGADKR